MENLESKQRKFEEMSSQTVDEKTNEDIASAIVETTRSLIMCLICSEVMCPPLTNQSSNGHLLCASCSKKCKQKRDTITYNRNLVLETIAVPLAVCCENESLGCKVNILRDASMKGLNAVPLILAMTKFRFIHNKISRNIFGRRI
jgi:hypothetical protein